MRCDINERMLSISVIHCQVAGCTGESRVDSFHFRDCRAAIALLLKMSILW